MKIHEYQGKEILRRFDIPTPRGIPAFSIDEAVKAAQTLGGKVWVVKAQIHAGGRGKGGGVKIAKSPAEVRSLAGKMIGMNLVTKQTGPAGREVKRVYIEAGCDIKRELYLGMLIDRGTGRITVMASAAGGMDIEEVAAATPEKILKVSIDPATGFMPHHARRIAYGLGLEGVQVGAAVKFMTGMYMAFTQLDASIIEINPLVVTGGGEVLALDAKMNFDDNALFRQKDVAELRDEDEEDPAEVEAGKHGLNYIKLDGSVACMVNGAGLAMATMDIIKYAGGSPANFLDVGGGASSDQVKNAFRILMNDPAVKAVFINIFGGILRCDVLATGVVAAAKDLQWKVPVVVRMEGTNVEVGQQILRDSGLNFAIARDMKDGAQKVVKLAGGPR